MEKRTKAVSAIEALAAAALVTAAVLLPSCSDDEKTPEDGEKPAVDLFTAEPATVSSGGTVELRWKVSNADTLSILQEGGDVLLENSTEFEGMRVTGALVAKTTFVLTAQNEAGSTSRTLVVEVSDGPSIVFFRAEPTNVAAGGTTTLSWDTRGATSVDIDIMGGANVLTSGAATGSFSSPPINALTRFILTAKDSEGRMATANVDVSVGEDGPRILSFAALPPAVDPGESTSLVWNVQNADRIVIRDESSTEIHQSTELMGTYAVTPSQSQTYTLIASKGTNDVTATARVVVNEPGGPIIRAFMANPTNVLLGMPTELSWQVENATGIEISTDEGVVYSAADLSGRWTTFPRQTTTFTLAAIGATRTTLDITVTVDPAAPFIERFEAMPNPAIRGQSSVLHYTVYEADTIRIFRGGSEVFTSTVGTRVQVDTIDVPVTVTSTTYVIEASNTLGSNTRSFVLYGHNRPSIVRFDVAPRSFAQAVTGTITYQVENTASLDLLADGVRVPNFMPVSTSTGTFAKTGTVTIALSQSATYELVASSLAGTVRAQVLVSRVIGAENEPNNNTAAGATPHPGDGGLFTGALSSGDADWYSVAVVEGGWVYVDTSNGQGDCDINTIVNLIAPDQSTVLVTNDNYTPNAPCSRIDPQNASSQAAAANLTAGTYYVQVQPGAGSSGPYSIAIRASAPQCGNGIRETRVQEICDDRNTVSGDGCSATCEVEPVDSLTGPGSDQTFAGGIEVAGQIDHYEIIMQAPGYISARVYVPSSPSCQADTVLRLLDENLDEIANNDDANNSFCSEIDPATTTASFVQPGTYYLAVEEYQNNAALPAYALVVRTIAVGCGNGLLETGESCDDGNRVSGDGCDSQCGFEGTEENEVAGNNTSSGSGVLSTTMDTIWSGAISPTGDRDFYRIDVPAGHHLDAYVTVRSFDACPEQPHARLQLYDTDGSTLLVSNTTGGPDGNCGRISPETTPVARAMDAGSYFLTVSEVEGDAEIDPYFLHVRVIAPGCGNGIIEGAETCDDGNTTQGDGCSATCTVEPLQVVTLPTQAPVRVVGSIATVGQTRFIEIQVTQAVLLLAETFVPSEALGCQATTGSNDTLITLADSTGTVLGVDDQDGIESCSKITESDAFARLEPGTYFLRIEESGGNAEIPAFEVVIRSITLKICGNGLFEPDIGEQCDDGGTAAGDGCDASCQFEISGTISSPGGTVSVTLPATDSYQIFQLQVGAGETVLAVAADPGLTTCNNVDTGLVLLLDDFRSFPSKAGGGPSGTAGTCGAYLATDVVNTNLAAGTYYLGVISQGGSGPVELAVTMNAPACQNGIIESEAGEQCDDQNAVEGDGCDANCQYEGEITYETEPNDAQATAGSIGLVDTGTRTVAGAISPVGDDDVWSFTVPANEPYAISIRTYSVPGDPEGCDADLTDTRIFLEANGIEVTEPDSGELAFNDDIDLTVYCSALSYSHAPAPSPTTYFVRVQGYEDVARSQYLMNISARVVPPFVSEVEPNDVQAAANPTGLSGVGSVTLQGANRPSGDDDVFSFVVPANQMLTLDARTYTIAGEPESCDGSLTDTHLFVEEAGSEQPSGVPLTENDDAVSGTVFCSAVEGFALPVNSVDTTYFIRIQGWFDLADTDYFLDVSLR